MNSFSNSLIPLSISTPKPVDKPVDLKLLNNKPMTQMNGLSLPLETPQNVSKAQSEDALRDAELRQSAEDFEAVFIAQMLKFSGLAEALTSSGGEDVAAFADIYIDKFAEDIVENGGFGLADNFYKKLKQQNQES